MVLDKNFSAKNVAQYSGIDLNSDTPPNALPRLDKTDKSAFRFFSAYNAALHIRKNAHQEAAGTGVFKTMNYEVIQQATKTLSLSQKRRFTRFDEQQSKKGILGLKEIITELLKSSTLSPEKQQSSIVKRVDTTAVGGWSVPDLELVADGYESLDMMKSKLKQTDFFTGKPRQLDQAKQVFNANSNLYRHDKSIWTNPSVQKSEDPALSNNPELNISDSSIKGYKIIFATNENTLRVQIGDIIGIKNDTAIEIGIIHRILQLTDNKLQLGINLLAHESELAYICLPNHSAVYAWVLYLPGIRALNSTASIIFNDSRFQCGEFINLYRTHQEMMSCRLSKLLNLSSAAAHIELFSPTIMNE